MECGKSLPELVEDAVSAHFAEHVEEIRARLRAKVEDAQLPMLDEFFGKIQKQYVRRIASLEENIRINDRTLQQIRQHSERSDDDLRRLSTGIDSLIE
jgi:response regulator of citrate/malate metabolism